MPCTATAIVHSSSPAASDVAKEHLHGPQDGIWRSGSGTDLVGMRWLRSKPQLWCSLSFSLFELSFPWPDPSEMAVDPRQVLAAFMTISMFGMLGNMIKKNHFDNARVSLPILSSSESEQYDQVRVYDLVKAKEGPWSEPFCQAKVPFEEDEKDPIAYGFLNIIIMNQCLQCSKGLMVPPCIPYSVIDPYKISLHSA